MTKKIFMIVGLLVWDSAYAAGGPPCAEIITTLQESQTCPGGLCVTLDVQWMDVIENNSQYCRIKIAGGDNSVGKQGAFYGVPGGEQPKFLVSKNTNSACFYYAIEDPAEFNNYDYFEMFYVSETTPPQKSRVVFTNITADYVECVEGPSGSVGSGVVKEPSIKFWHKPKIIASPIGPSPEEPQKPKATGCSAVLQHIATMKECPEKAECIPVLVTVIPFQQEGVKACRIEAVASWEQDSTDEMFFGVREGQFEDLSSPTKETDGILTINYDVLDTETFSDYKILGVRYKLSGQTEGLKNPINVISLNLSKGEVGGTGSLPPVVGGSGVGSTGGSTSGGGGCALNPHR